MPVRTHLTFANLASATALVVAVTGVGGLAVADGTVARLAKGSVTSKHIKNGTIKPADLKDGAVTGAKVADGSITGADVTESSLAQVPSAASAASASTATTAATATNSGDVLRAVVAFNGALVPAQSEHAVSATGTGGGSYTVTFDRPVTSCTYVATPAPTGSGGTPFAWHASATGSSSSANAVLVWTFSTTPTMSPAPFHLIVAC